MAYLSGPRLGGRSPDTGCARAAGSQPIRLLKPAEVQERLGVSRSWLYASAQTGRIPSLRLGGPEGPLRFHPDDLDEWIDELRGQR